MTTEQIKQLQTKEDKKEYTKIALAPLLKVCNRSIASVECFGEREEKPDIEDYDGNVNERFKGYELIIITYDNGARDYAIVNCDSYSAMVKDCFRVMGY